MAAALLMLPANRAFNSNGIGVPGAVAKLYTTGTATPANFYSTSALDVSLGSSITANAAGRFTAAYGDDTIPYRLIIEDALGVELDDIDPYYFGTTFGSVIATANSNAATRVLMAALTGVAGATVTLSEAGREGVFVFDDGDLATEVSADPEEGIYVAPTTDATGASGAWVRQYTGLANVSWWGMSPSATAAANVTALNAAIALMASQTVAGGYGSNSRGLWVPPGNHLLNAAITLDHAIAIEGTSSGAPSGGGSILTWAAGSHGFNITETGARLKGLAIMGGYAGVAGDFHGVRLRATATIEDCYIANWQGNNIDGDCTSAANGGVEPAVGNCIGTFINRCFLQEGKNGIFFDGADSSACNIYATRSFLNREWGVHDSSFLGNTYVGCETLGNTLGGYKTVGASNRSLFLNCYAEADQAVSAELDTDTWFISGLTGGSVTGGIQLLSNTGLITTPNAITTTNGFGITAPKLTTSGAINLSGALGYQGAITAGGRVVHDGAEGLLLQGKGTSSRSVTMYSGEGALAFSVELGTNGGDCKVHQNLNVAGVIQVDGTQVVSNQGAAVADATDAASAITQLNALLARCRAHGLIAT